MSYPNSQPASQYTSASPTATPIGWCSSLLIFYQNQLYLQNTQYFCNVAVLTGMLDPEDKGTMIIQNTGYHLSNDTG
jgi:hypothetical protein